MKFQIRFFPPRNTQVPFELNATSEDPNVIRELYEVTRTGVRNIYGGTIEVRDVGGSIPHSTLLSYCSDAP